jgi:hypothetical protein
MLSYSSHMQRLFVIALTVLISCFAQQIAFSRDDRVSSQQQQADETFGCKILPYKGEDVSYGTEDLRGGVECRFEIRPNLPVYKFHLIADAASNTIVRIEIRREKDDSHSQILEVENVESPYRGSEYFGTDDINFDGYQDLRLLAWWGVTGNSGYIYWIFDPKTGKFVENKELQDLSNPIPHPKTKTITTSSVGGMAGRIHFLNTYSFEKSKLTLIRTESQDWDEKKKHFVKTISERRNGKMVVIRTQIITR